MSDSPPRCVICQRWCADLGLSICRCCRALRGLRSVVENPLLGGLAIGKVANLLEEALGSAQSLVKTFPPAQEVCKAKAIAASTLPPPNWKPTLKASQSEPRTTSAQDTEEVKAKELERKKEKKEEKERRRRKEKSASPRRGRGSRSPEKERRRGDRSRDRQEKEAQTKSDPGRSAS